MTYLFFSVCYLGKAIKTFEKDEQADVIEAEFDFVKWRKIQAIRANLTGYSKLKKILRNPLHQLNASFIGHVLQNF